jgi:hypothetical protein
VNWPTAIVRMANPETARCLWEVMIDGWPIAHHLFEETSATAPRCRAWLKTSRKGSVWGVVFVGDRGMVTSQNIDLLRSATKGTWWGSTAKASRGDGLPRAAGGQWQECQAGIAASEKAECQRL